MTNSLCFTHQQLEVFFFRRSSIYLKIKERKIAETQADLYAGFFGQVSGDNTLTLRKRNLNAYHNLFGLKKIANGYPSFDERIEIIQTKEAEANEIVILFALLMLF